LFQEKIRKCIRREDLSRLIEQAGLEGEVARAKTMRFKAEKTENEGLEAIGLGTELGSSSSGSGSSGGAGGSGRSADAGTSVSTALLKLLKTHGWLHKLWTSASDEGGASGDEGGASGTSRSSRQKNDYNGRRLLVLPTPVHALRRSRLTAAGVALGKDIMEKDIMEKDVMEKGALEKGALEKGALEKDIMEKSGCDLCDTATTYCKASQNAEYESVFVCYCREGYTQVSG
jgi:pentapeptide MXKDX repeat protein